MRKPIIVALDFESILIPEIWLDVALNTGIKELEITTRECPDFKKLMQKRIMVLREHGLKLRDIQEIIKKAEPLPGSIEFVDWLYENFQFIILSETFHEFAKPFLKKFHYPTIFCHSLVIDKQGHIVDYHIRESGDKKSAVQALKSIGFYVIAIGDSYNDLEMLQAADEGVLFNASKNVSLEFPHFRSFNKYEDIKKHINDKLKSKNEK